MNVLRTPILHLYSHFLRNSRKIDNYNFRLHAIRRIKYGFKTNVNAESNRIQQLYDYGLDQLGVVKRQSLISQLYPEAASVVESKKIKLHV